MNLADFRAQAAVAWQAQGLPHKQEHWKYTPLEGWKQHLLQATRVLEAESLNPDITDLIKAVPEMPYRVVFIDGCLAAQHSRLPTRKGFQCRTLLDAITEDAQLIPHIQQATSRHALGMLHNACLQQGLSITLQAHTTLDAPLQVLYIYTLNCTITEQAKLASPTLHIALEESSVMDLIEQVISPSDLWASNHLSLIALGPHARCTHGLLQHGTQGLHQHIISVQQQAHSVYTQFNYSLHNTWLRRDIHIQQQDPHAQTTLLGLYSASQSSYVDNHLNIEHASDHGRSQTRYKGIVDESARAVFNGRIHVHAQTQHVDAKLHNANLLLSAQAEIDTKPELEIYADAVQCSHGATVGQLDADALFYLQSRGLNYSDARAMLIRGFAAELMEALPWASVRDYVMELYP